MKRFIFIALALIISTVGLYAENYIYCELVGTTKLMSNKVKVQVDYGQETSFWKGILNQITNLSKGRLYIFSEGAYYLNNFGKFTKGECSYWKGTIIYMFLRLSTPKTLSDIEDFTSEEFNDLKINFQ